MHALNYGRAVILGAVWLLAACGGDEVTTLGTSAPGTSTTVDTTAGPGTESPTGEGPSTGADTGSATATATMPTTASTDPDTSAGPSTSEPPVTTGPQTSDTGDSGESGSSGDTSESGSSGDTGVMGTACETADDCLLIDDCCRCEPIGPGEMPPKCDIQECFVNQCAPKGLEGAPLACRFGRCTFEKVVCNPVAVICKSLPPDCGPGDVPSVDEAAACWTGQCVPAEACDWVPDCSYCDEEELVCVQKLQKGAFEVCEPKPIDCGDVDEIDCACGQQICDASPPHTKCADAIDGISCECEVC